MSGRQRIPDDLADIPPGPELATVLGGIEPSRLCGFDTVEVLRAQYRQLNHDRARLLATMVEVGLAGIDPDDEPTRRDAPDEFAADEVRAALVLTRRAADAQFWLAYDLCTRLPAVHAAMAAGACDEPRARIFSEWTSDLSDPQARAVCDRLLPRLGELTTGQLIDQIKKLAIALDPDWARRRYEQAVAGRKVVGYRNSDGSANLSGVNLPVDRAAAASARIDALAKAAKRAGSSRRIDHLRADLFLGITDGTYTGLDDATILALLLATGDDTDTRDSDGEPGPGGDQPDDQVPAGGHGRGDIELRVRLSTLLGRDRYPAEIAGWGPVHADVARDLIPSLLRAEWRFVITDDRGRPCHTGITRARPAGFPARTGRSNGVVELQVPAGLLDALARDGEVGPWAAVIADLVRQRSHHEKTAQPGAEPFAGDADRRHPGAGLRRHLQIRDRRCVGPGCRAPARHTDQDHTRDYRNGGRTLTGNLGTACRHDHRLKGEGEWTLVQPEPGHFRWTSRLGHTYDVHPEPIIEPLPDPIPRDRDPVPLVVLPDEDWEHDHILEHPPPEPQPPPSPPYDPERDIPPF